MRKTRIMFVSLLAVFAVGAVASSSASAALLWLINGKGSFGTAAISNAAITITGGKLEGDNIAITCPTLKIEGGLLKEGETGMATSATFSSCKETNEEANCELSTSTIGTNPGSANAADNTEIEIKPEGTTVFTAIKINNKSGKICLIKGKYEVEGAARLTLNNASTEETEHELILNKQSKLKINTNPATIEGSGKGKLESKLPWSLMP